MVPLLVKMGWTDLVDRLLVIDCDVETQRQRLLQRDDIDLTLANSMIAAQETREERRDAADDLILNAGSLTDLDAMTGICHQAYLDFSEGRSNTISALWLPDQAALVQ
jgi:dephospho-CoA kinase